LLELRKDRAEVGRERIQVAEVGPRDLDAAPLAVLDRRARGAVGGAPADHERLGILGAVDLDFGDLLGDALDLGRSDAAHELVVLGIVVDAAIDMALLDAADAVLHAGRARDGPVARQRYLVPE